MEYKEITKRETFQELVLKAAQILAHPVVSTLGPDGCPILIERTGMPPLLTKDGVTVANSINVKDPKLNTIIQAIKEAALRTNELVGDGTTSAILLTESLIRHSQPFLRTKAISPQGLGAELMSISEKIVEQLKAAAIPIRKEPNQVRNVALISANGEQEIAEAVFQAIDGVGEDGVVTLEEGGTQTTVRIEEGFAINRGWSSFGPSGGLLVNVKMTQEVIYQNPVVAMYSGMLENTQDLATFLHRVTGDAQKVIPIIIMAHDFAPPIVKMIVQNVAAGIVQILPVKIPKLGVQHSQADSLEDIATLTGGKVVYPSAGGLADITDEHLGRCEKAVSGRRQTVIFGGDGDETLIEGRLEWIRGQMKEAFSQFDKDIMKERLGRLIGGVAVIEVGGLTELEMKEKKDRIEDALNATRAALEEGVVDGGGVALIRAFAMIPAIIGSRGYDVFKSVAQEPLRQIIRNMGTESEDVVLDRVMRGEGFDAKLAVFVPSLVDVGIIDPVKVTITALRHATSIAASLLTGGGSVTLSKKQPKVIENYMTQDEEGSDGEEE